MFKILLLLVFIISLVNGHGYSLYPLARQVVCSSNPNNAIYYPENGDGIKDPACRAAFKHVYNKQNSASQAQYQFIQTNEYAINIAGYASGYSALTAAIKDDLCSAGQSVAPNDKSGMSIPSTWTVTNISVADKSAKSKKIRFEYCATAPHTPSYWEFYVTKEGFDVSSKKITWNDLVLFQEVGEVPVTTTNNPKCTVTKAYVMDIELPARYSNAVLYSRWQRKDPVGEGFYNCADFKFIADNDPTSSGGNTNPSTGGEGDGTNNSSSLRVSFIVLLLVLCNLLF